MSSSILPFQMIKREHVLVVGGKNANLGMLMRDLAGAGVRVPDGFAVVTRVFREHLRRAQVDDEAFAALDGLDRNDVESLARVARQLRDRIVATPLADGVAAEIADAYRELSRQSGEAEIDVAVRSSAAVEDLPEASFAGQQDSYLNVRGVERVLEMARRCMASLFTERSIVYRRERGFTHHGVALSVGIQRMVHSDLACAGMMSTLDTESGFRDVVQISGAWGLGESVVQGRVCADEALVHKPSLAQGFTPILQRRIGNKTRKVVYAENGGTRDVPVEGPDRTRFVLADHEILQLARWGIAIETRDGRYSRPTPMDIEWAKDGVTGELYIVQARQETVHAQHEPAELDLPEPPIPVMLTVDNPDAAFVLGQLPSAGVGLARIELIISSQIGIHPMALAHPERVVDRTVRAAIADATSLHACPAEMFVDRLASSVARIGAAFYPRPVIVRFSDLASNEHAQLIGGSELAPIEATPTLGASGYYHPHYRDAFALECRALLRVRDTFGLRNIKVMIPCCRTVDEARRVLAELATHGLARGVHGLEVHTMAEVPSNELLAAQLAELFDGFSVDFDDQDSAMIVQLIETAHRCDRPVGICGQGPSDRLELASLLVGAGIDSLSVTADSLPRVVHHLAHAVPPTKMRCSPSMR